MNNGKLTRRAFVGGLAAGAAAGFSGCGSSASPRWYKGMLHAHSLWSDGKVLPEQAVKIYKDAGYDFFSLTEHNLTADGTRWFPVGPEKPGWPPKTVDVPVFEAFRRTFPDADVRTAGDGGTEVRLATYKELRARFEEPGRFLFLPGCEITTKTKNDEGAFRDLHMNYVGLAGLPEYLKKEPMVSTRPGKGVSREISFTAAETAKLAKAEGGASHVFFLNHPHWRYYDILAQDLIAAPEVRFFELCNNGSVFAPDPRLPQDGFDNDRLWDAVNAFRAKHGQPLLYALASDDTHNYPGCGMRTRRNHFGDGWICVRASSLTQDALFAAMLKGEFYASCGVDFEDVSFDAKSGTLSVSVPAKADAAYTVRFITSKKSAPLEPVTVVRIAADPKKRIPERAVPVYHEGIGTVVKTEAFAKGERAVASYTLAADDLYVRARVESTEPSVYPKKNRMHPEIRVGWTQPFVS